MRKWQGIEFFACETWSEVYQVVLPKVYIPEVMHMAHDLPMAGHFI